MRTVPAGQNTTVEALAAAAAGRVLPGDAPATLQGSRSAGDAPADVAAEVAGHDETPERAGRTPFMEALAETKARFDAALDAADAGGATAATLATEQLIRDWAADTQQSDEMDAAVGQLRGMITRLGALAAAGMHDHTELVRPHIETLLHLRDTARQRKAYDEADHIRGHMSADGVTVKDTRDGVEWEWAEPELDDPAQKGSTSREV